MLTAVLINPTSAIGHHGCTLVCRQLEAIALEAGIQVVSRLPLASDWDKLAPAAFDLVLVNGEGTLHSNSKGAGRIANVPDWSLKHGVPCFLVNTIYENNDEAIAGKIRMFTLVFARDSSSAAELNKRGIAASWLPDLSWTWQPELSAKEKRPRSIAVMGSTLQGLREELYELSRSLDADYLPILARPASNITGGNTSRLSKYYVKRTLARIPFGGAWRARWRNAKPTFEEFVDSLNQATCLITGRFHGAIMAMHAGVPVLALRSNTRKMDTLFAELGMTHRLFSTVDDIRNVIRSNGSNSSAPLLSYSDAERQIIASRANEARGKAQDMMASIAEATRNSASGSS
jgi:polysaccharide pyruvyl transferase WcaK-like protein